MNYIKCDNPKCDGDGNQIHVIATGKNYCSYDCLGEKAPKGMEHFQHKSGREFLPHKCANPKCDEYIISSGRRGQPKKYCSNSCRVTHCVARKKEPSHTAAWKPETLRCQWCSNIFTQKHPAQTKYCCLDCMFASQKEGVRLQRHLNKGK